MAEADGAAFSFTAGVLRVNRELDEIEAVTLEEEVRRLADSDVAAPVLDLGGVSYVPSYHIEGIRSAASRCTGSGRSMTVRARRNVTMMLDRMGLGAVARLKTVDE